MSTAITAADLIRPKILREKIARFVDTELWRNELPPLFSARGALMRMARYLHMMVSGSRADELRLLAASLTYSSLMAMVPLLAMMLAIFKGLGYDTLLSDYIEKATAEMPEQVQALAQQTLEVVNRTNFAQLGGIGAAALLLMVVQILSRIEASFNRVWGIKRDRNLFQKITNYISTTVIVPILLLAAITFTAQLRFGGALFEQLGLLQLAPFLATWIALAFFYQAMPNTRVRFLPAAASGFTGALLFHLWLRLYILLQPGVARYNVLYGTLAAVPIFLGWLYVSWMIVLLGAKVAYAIQNGSAYQMTQTKGEASLRTQLTIAGAILVHAARALRDGTPPLDARAFAAERGLNPLLLEDTLRMLTEGGLLAEVADEEGGRYTLLKAADRITIGEIRDLLLDHGDSLGDLGVKPPPAELAQALEGSLDSAEFDDLTLADLVQREVDRN